MNHIHWVKLLNQMASCLFMGDQIFRLGFNCIGGWLEGRFRPRYSVLKVGKRKYSSGVPLRAGFGVRLHIMFFISLLGRNGISF